MIPLNAILSTNDFVLQLPQGVAAVCAAILLIAFFVGFAKGFKRVAWEWVACLIGFVGYVLLDGLLTKKNLIINLPTIGGLSGKALTSFIIAFFCLAVSSALYGICSALFRPREVWVKKDRFLFRREQKAGIGDGNPRRLVYKNYAPPNILGRLFGAIVCVLNTAVIMALVLSAFLFLINATELSSMKLGLILQVNISQKALEYATQYVLGFITLCIPFFLACYGFKRGFITSLRTVVMNAGSALTVGVAFWLPFSPFVGKSHLNFLGKLIGRCTAILANIPEKLKPFVAKILAGLLLLVVLLLILFFIVYLLKKYEKMLEKVKFMKYIDSLTSCIIYFLIGIGVCIAVWSLLYTLDLYQIFKISEVINEDSILAKDFFAFAKSFMDPFLIPKG